MRVIINADDCGYSVQNTSHIKMAIEAGKITSTTIMANMDDVEGAISLYHQYSKDISFGCHLNLIEGEPLVYSKELDDFGYYIKQDGKVLFGNADKFRYKRLPENFKRAIYYELAAQIKKLQEGGVNISHLDSHSHVHTSPSLFEVISTISKDFNIPKVRRIRNYISNPLSFAGRQAWAYISKAYNRNYVFTDYFAIFEEYITNSSLRSIKASDTLELMIHPGHSMESYQKEESIMLEMKYPQDFELINYNQL